MTNILEKIVQDKKESLVEIKKANSLDVLENKIKTLNNFFNFKQAITKNKNIYFYVSSNVVVGRVLGINSLFILKTLILLIFLRLITNEDNLIMTNKSNIWC